MEDLDRHAILALPELERAQFYKRTLAERNCSQKDLAKELGIHPNDISLVFSYLRLCDEAQALMSSSIPRENRLSTGAARMLLELQPLVQKALLENFDPTTLGKNQVAFLRRKLETYFRDMRRRARQLRQLSSNERSATTASTDQSTQTNGESFLGRENGGAMVTKPVVKASIKRTKGLFKPQLTMGTLRQSQPPQPSSPTRQVSPDVALSTMPGAVEQWQPKRYGPTRMAAAPSRGSFGTEMHVEFWDASVSRYVSSKVDMRKYLKLWRDGDLGFQGKHPPYEPKSKPSHYPTEAEAEKAIRIYE